MIEYHIVGFGIIDGYCYGQGRNHTIHHVIEDRYNLRKKLEKDNPAQMAITLLMNSMYGKTIIKPVDTDTILKYSKGDFEKYASHNCNY